MKHCMVWQELERQLYFRKQSEWLQPLMMHCCMKQLLLFQQKQERSITWPFSRTGICNTWGLLSGRPTLIFFVIHDGGADRKPMAKILFLPPVWAQHL